MPGKLKGYLNNGWVIFFIFVFLIIAIFALTQPRISNTLLYPKRSSSVNSVVKRSVSEDSIDTKKVWQLRDFYSVSGQKIENKPNPDLSKIMDGFTDKNYIFPFATLTSRNVESFDGLTNLPDLNSFQGKKFILKNDNNIIYSDGKDKVFIFLRDQNDLSKTNGLYDFEKNNIRTKSDDKWLDVTVFRM